MVIYTIEGAPDYPGGLHGDGLSPHRKTALSIRIPFIGCVIDAGLFTVRAGTDEQSQHNLLVGVGARGKTG